MKNEESILRIGGPMRFPKYWARGTARAEGAKGRAFEVSAFGWSDVSAEEARRVGDERARRALGRVEQEERGGTGGYYTDVPPREEILERVVEGRREIAVLTRNGYGATVLNTDCVLFVDIDADGQGAGRGAQDAGLMGRLRSLFVPEGEKRAKRGGGDAIEERVRTWCLRNREAGVRLYRTCAGWRVLFTDGLYEPKSERVSRIFAELGADPLYVKLTERQSCFRARLTPKPWRCGFQRPYASYPFENEKSEALFRKWEAEYAAKAKGFSTCAPPIELGPPARAAEVRRIVELHDRLACTGAGKLA